MPRHLASRSLEATAVLAASLTGALAPWPAHAAVPRSLFDTMLAVYDSATKEISGLRGHTAEIQERVQRLGMASRSEEQDEWIDARLLPAGRALLRDHPGVQYLGIWARDVFPPSMRDLELALEHALEDYARRDPRPCFDADAREYRPGEACDALVKAHCGAFAGNGKQLVARTVDSQLRPAALPITSEDAYVDAFRRMTHRRVARGEDHPDPLSTDERIDYLFCRAVAEGGKRFETRWMVASERPAWTSELASDELPLSLEDFDTHCRAPIPGETVRAMDELLDGPRAAQNDAARRLFAGWRHAVRARRVACDQLVQESCAPVQVVAKRPSTISYNTVDCRRREVTAAELQSDVMDMQARDAPEEKLAGLTQRVEALRMCEQARRAGYAWSFQPPPMSQRCISMPAPPEAQPDGPAPAASAAPTGATTKNRGKGKAKAKGRAK